MNPVLYYFLLALVYIVVLAIAAIFIAPTVALCVGICMIIAKWVTSSLWWEEWQIERCTDKAEQKMLAEYERLWR